MKTCFKCNTEKPLSEYYRLARMADGHLNKCKECTKLDVKNHRTDNLNKVREYDRRRSILPHRIEHITQNTKKYRANNPEKWAAHQAVNHAVRYGRMVKPKCCQSCGIDGRLHGHHDDYSKPLDVMWLCVPCHAVRHRELKQQRAA